METQELIIIETFCKEYQIERSLIIELEEFGLIQTIQLKENRYLHKAQLATVEKIIRLHHELNINIEGIEVILNLLEKVAQLNTDIKHLKDRLDLYE
jgi:DNA-binding transcriptional MerR regulator